MKIAALCDGDTAIGMRFGGITNVFVPEKNANIQKIFYDIVKKDEFGVLFVSEGLASGMNQELKEYRMQNLFPIIVEVPDKHGHPKGHVDFVSHLIKRAVGIEIEENQPI